MSYDVCRKDGKSMCIGGCDNICQMPTDEEIQRRLDALAKEASKTLRRRWGYTPKQGPLQIGSYKFKSKKKK